MEEVPPAEPHLVADDGDPSEQKDETTGDDANIATGHPERGEPSIAVEVETDVVLESYFYQLTGELVDCKCITNRNLKVLSIFGQLNLKTLDGVENLTNLSELWVVECSLEEANQVNNCTHLRKLYLYSNNLKDIPDVKNLRNLSTLWLSGNAISSLKKFQDATEVKDLNIANNLVSDLSPLKGHAKLEVLNLAGNPLENFQSVEPLVHLPRLRKLTMADPLYKVTPLTSSVNYRAFVTSKLDQLRVLDNFLIEYEERDLAESYFSRKCRYYKILLNNALNKVFTENHKRTSQSYGVLRNLKNALSNNCLNETKAVKDKNKVLEEECLERKKALEAACFQWEIQHNKWNELLERDFEVTYELLELEMKNYGNVNFIDQTKDVNLLYTIKTRMQTFLCPYVKRNTSLKSIEIDKVIQVISIQNRYFYDFEGVKEVMNGNVTRGQFLMLDVPAFHSNQSNQWALDFLKRYCSSSEKERVYCTLTNSFAIMDCEFLKSHEFISKEKRSTRKSAILAYISGETQFESCSREEVLRNHVAFNEESSDNCYYCTMHRKTLSSQVIPAFMVEYHYEYPAEELGDDCLNVQASSKTPSLSVVMCPRIKTNTWAQLRELNISKMSIQTFGLMQTLPNIQVLDVSYNKIKSLSEISTIFPNLILLVVSFNEIQSVTSIKDMKCLEELDLKWNRLSKFIATLQYLKKTCTSLHNLDLSHNCFSDLHDPKHGDLFLNRLLPSLRKYNGEWLDRKEFTVTYHFSPRDFPTVLLTDKMKKEMKKDRKLLWSGALCSVNARRSHVAVDSTGFPECIYLYRESTMHEFRLDVNREILKWISVTRNQLMKSNFLNQFVNLEEVDLSFNALQSITDTFYDLKKLRKLNLTCNYLTSLEPFKNCDLPSLKVLNVSKNLLKTLQGVESLVNIEELYASANDIKKWESLDFIKYLKSLKIVDVSLNPVDDPQMLRKYLIFHGSKLEYINGSPIKDDEIIEANESLSGVLDRDYLFKMYKPYQVHALTELTVRKVGLRKVSLGDLDMKNLTSVNLESNSLMTFSGLNALPNLKYLCLTNNQITSYGPSKNPFGSLEVLYLNFNNLSNLVPLDLQNFPKLTTLFLQDNQLLSADGLQELRRLQFLVLDRNKIANILKDDFKLLLNLKELYLESNLIKDLTFAKSLVNLKRLFLAHNRIQDKESIESLETLQKLRDVTIIGNPICRFNMHLSLILSTLPRLQYLDGHLVEEKSEFPMKRTEE